MEMKNFLWAMGLGMAAGTAVGMMMPRNSHMQSMGTKAVHTAADTICDAAQTMEKKLT